MKLVIAEKPSVMRDIAAVLGAAQKTADGALCGNGYIVTSARPRQNLWASWASPRWATSSTGSPGAMRTAGK